MGHRLVTCTALLVGLASQAAQATSFVEVPDEAVAQREVDLGFSSSFVALLLCPLASCLAEILELDDGSLTLALDDSEAGGLHSLGAHAHVSALELDDAASAATVRGRFAFIEEFVRGEGAEKRFDPEGPQWLEWLWSAPMGGSGLEACEPGEVCEPGAADAPGFFDETR